MKTFCFVAPLVVAILGVAMFWRLTLTQESTPETEKPTRIVAEKDLSRFTLLKGDHLEVTGANGQNGAKSSLVDRYLLVDVKKGDEIRDEMLAAPDAKTILADARLVSVPATTTTTLGGQLRAGELVDLVAVTATNPTGKKFENLVALSSTQPGKDSPPLTTIMLAVPSTKLDEFASAIAGAQLLVSRKIIVNK